MFVMSVTFVAASHNTRNTRNSPYEDAALWFAEAVGVRETVQVDPRNVLADVQMLRNVLRSDALGVCAGSMKSQRR